ncbi:hypothetical protein KKA00_11145 [bacterium]|nr:hypothetical protein [bacterium]MBU1652769.1 hypothetical protein [bacterium]
MAEKYFLISRRLQPEEFTRISSQAKRNTEILARFDPEFDAKLDLDHLENRRHPSADC